ncbi:MAG: isochorismatase family protein [Solirubrobacterales bacterium]|nr:isochorismatase family protein [Solirubrobacterales bacterium]
MPEALLIIDVQNDFLPDGALAVPDGDQVIGPINALAADPRFDVVVATRDWHPADHDSFVDQGGPWPAHCVQGTPGAELSADLRREAIDAVIDTGTVRGDEGYSGFEGEELRELLRSEQVDAVTIVGLATDVCVKHTAADALREGLQVTIETAGVRGIDARDSREALRGLAESGAQVN